MADQRQFQNLDALRGVAAICVMFRHMPGGLMPAGGLAVDFFFMLSGFVIAHAYEARLVGGLSFKGFALRRIIRLWPMIALGVTLGLLCALFAIAQGATSLTVAQVLGLSLKSALLIPQTQTIHSLDEVFPLNGPLWSLFFEVAVNLAYALGAYRLSRGPMAALAALGLVAVVMIGDLGGHKVDSLASGFPRVLFGFLAGVLLHRAWAAGWVPPVRVPLLGLAAALVGLFLVPVPLAGLALVPVFAVLAAIVALSARSDAQTEHKAAAALGQVSYPLYAIHVPIFNLFAIGLAATPLGAMAQGLIVLVGVPVVSIGGAYAAFHWIDLPARRALTRWFVGGRREVSPGSVARTGSEFA